jgi:hypothetical protein
MSQSFGNSEVGSPCQGCPNTVPPGPTASHEDEDTKKHWIEILLLDERTGAPRSQEEYLIVLPDGVEVHGRLDSNGSAYVGGIEQAGPCDVSFPKLDGKEWKSK